MVRDDDDVPSLRLGTPSLTLIPPTTFDEIRRSCKFYQGRVEGKYAELGVAARWVSTLAREVTEQVRKIEGKAKAATAEHVSLKEVLHEYLEVFADEDSLWETLDLAHDPKERTEFTRRSVLTPKVLKGGLQAFRSRVVALTAERDAFRARRAHDVAHFESAVAELKQMQEDRMDELEEGRQAGEWAADQRLKAEKARADKLEMQLGAMKARADWAEARLRREVEGREEDRERAEGRREALEDEISRLAEALESMSKGAHLSDIAHANALVARQMGQRGGY